MLKTSYTYDIPINIDRISSVKFLNDKILAGKRRGFLDYRILITDSTTYSNVCAPIAGVLDYYRSQGMTFDILYDSPNPYPDHTHFADPLNVEDYIGKIELQYPLDKVWKFDSPETVNELLKSYIFTIRQSDIIERGVISSLEWCLNETMDNILQHAEVSHGYIMAQLHKTSKRFSVCVFDVGRGIYNSLKNSKHHPVAPLDAITLALQEKVTRDERVGQGNGLWGLSRLITEADGLLRISSAGATYQKEYDEIKTVLNGDFNLGKSLGTTLVDFQFDYSKPIDVTTALNGYYPTDFWLEDLEINDEELEINVGELSSGTGTRKAAEKFRNMIINLVLSDKKRVILNFNGVNLVSSSYADELIGKIISKYGFVFFINNFHFKNLSVVNGAVINRSVQQRMAQTYYDSQIQDIADEF